MSSHRLSLFSATGLVIANMVGAGVFLSTGFMVQTLTPMQVMLGWSLGGLMALTGAYAYTGVTRAVSGSGGEYRYLASVFHPLVGYIAGWGSLILGFAAPVAVDALAAGAFAHVLFPSVPAQAIALTLILVVAGVHISGLKFGVSLQNALVALKLGIILFFIVTCVAMGTLHWPTWEPPAGHTEFSYEDFFSNLFYVAFAYSGWNAVVYLAAEFRDSRKTLLKATLLGCLSVTLLYLMLNYLFVANLTPNMGAAVFGYSAFAEQHTSSTHDVTLAHAMMKQFLGDGGANITTGIIVLIFMSALSAMTLVGPRVSAAMADDGFLPTFFQFKAGGVPRFGVLFQSLTAAVLVLTASLKDVLLSVGAVLTLFSAATAACIFVLYPKWKSASEENRVDLTHVLSALVFVGFSVVMLYFGFRSNLSRLLWLGIAAAVFALLGYLTMKFSKPNRNLS